VKTNLLPKLKSKEWWSELRDRSKPLLLAAYQHFPNLVEEIRGFAEAAQVHFEDIWAANCFPDVQMCKKHSFYDREGGTTIVTNNGNLISLMKMGILKWKI